MDMDMPFTAGAAKAPCRSAPGVRQADAPGRCALGSATLAEQCRGQREPRPAKNTETRYEHAIPLVATMVTEFADLSQRKT